MNTANHREWNDAVLQEHERVLQHGVFVPVPINEIHCNAKKMTSSIRAMTLKYFLIRKIQFSFDHIHAKEKTHMASTPIDRGCASHCAWDMVTVPGT
jgi:hypothetical protein